MFNLRSAVVWVTLLQLTGCAGASGSTADASANISNVEIGMTQKQVLPILGQPRMRETYGGTEFLIYPNGAEGSIPIAIVDGRVTSIGRNVYDIVARSAARSGTPPR